MKNELILILSSLIMAIFTNCGRDLDLYNEMTSELKEFTNIEKLDPQIMDLSQSDAVIVANLFNQNRKTRMFQNKTIKDIVTLSDRDGYPAIYVVNFNEDGYLLISATKKYYPILGFVEHGTYSSCMPETGQEIIIEGMIANIEVAKKEPIDHKIFTLWNKYTQTLDAKIKNPTRSIRFTRLDPTDDYYEAFDWFCSQFYRDNCRIIKLTNCRDLLPENVYEEFVASAKSEDLWEGTEYYWGNTAYVVEETVQTLTSIGPLLTTHWDQAAPFNTTQYKYLGCVTIATGQIMKFHKFPTNYNWENMPNDEESETLCNFLGTLRTELGVNSEGSAKIGDAERVLKSKGYNVTQISHDVTKIFNELKYNKRPVYARGQKSLLQGGHAWVIDGLYHSTATTTYTLYRLTDTSYPEFRYDSAENTSPYSIYSNVTTFHMNWGWGGNCDGWFNDDNIRVSTSSEIRDYSYDRKELLVSKP